ncbi:tRNA-splicing endonuclease subunit Sen2 isoform X2 [Aricia agestis]|nr:tRNA-splicing endonuclease subunit Sen2 isoform X2 [Aricia agestis]
MTSLTDNCQSNDLNSTHPMEIELKFPLDTGVNSMQMLFTGYFNGLGVEVKSFEEIGFLYHMGCFGKGSMSRSQPAMIQTDELPCMMRKRQFQKRNYWYKRFLSSQQNKDGDLFFKHVDELMSKLVRDGKQKTAREVIDLVSTDEEEESLEDCSLNSQLDYNFINKENVAVIVPNSDSEDDDYFSTMKPKSCLNKVKIEEKLMLSLQESFYLVYALECLQVLSLENQIMSTQQCWDLFCETEKCFLEKYVVYHYLRSKGYVVKPGIKFGGDYLLYREGPGINHADYIVVVKCGDDQFDWISILGHVRMANTTVKEVMIVEVVKSSKEDIKLPNDLGEYSVREIILTRNIPATINNDDE